MPDLVANRVLIWVQIPNGVPDRVPGLTRYQVCYQISNLLRTSARLEKEIGTRSVAVFRIRSCTRTGTSLVPNTTSGPRSERLVVLEWSWGGVALGGTFGAVFERFSGVLKRSWGVLERLGVILGRLGTVLRRPGTSWGGLGSSRKRLVAILEPSWGVLRPSWDHLGATLGRPWVVLGLFWAVLECSLAPFCGYRANFENHQKPTVFVGFFRFGVVSDGILWRSWGVLDGLEAS